VINWNFFPRSKECPVHLLGMVEVFRNVEKLIDSETHKEQHSDTVLAKVAPGLGELGYRAERGKGKADKVKVPVLFGQNGTVLKSFDADAWNYEERTVLEVEAGRAVANNQFLKDLFQACMMHDVDYLAIAVRNIYQKSNRDFESVSTFMETLYASGRLTLPLTGILIIGY
jgi:hypothetical protein